MKFQYQFICLCFGAILLYLICFYSPFFKEKLNEQQVAYSTVKPAKIRNDHFIISKTVSNKSGDINNTQIERLEKHEDCSRFVSASCDYGSMKTRFKKLPEKFARVSTLNCFML